MNASELRRELEERAQARELYLNDFHAFVRDAWTYTTPSGKPFQDQPYIEIICEHLEALQSGQLSELIINQPPGTGKSRICSILWPAWCWAKDPKECILFASFSQGLGIEMGEYITKLLRSPWYRRLFAPRLPTVAPPSDFQLENGGWRLATTPGGQVTGSHGTIRQLDDPIKAEDATKKECENVNHWLDNSWISRRDLFAAKVRDLCVMQRLSETDPAQHLMDQGWPALVLPFHYEPKKYVETRTLPNGDELLCDWRKDKDEVLTPLIAKDYIDKLQPYVYHSQYQQTPTGEGDRVFKPEWLEKRWDEQPTRGLWCISVDAAFKGEPTSDFVVMQVWCKLGADFYLVDQVRGHWDFDETCAQLKALATKWPQARAKLVEAKANGDAIISHLTKLGMSGIEAITPEGGKLSRASAVTPYFAAGNVLLADKAWLPDMVKEFSVFPRGKNDDQVDACSQALVWLADRTRHVALTPDVKDALIGKYQPEAMPVQTNYQAWRLGRLRTR